MRHDNALAVASLLSLQSSGKSHTPPSTSVSMDTKVTFVKTGQWRRQDVVSFRALVMQYIQRCGIGVWFTRLGGGGG